MAISHSCPARISLKSKAFSAFQSLSELLCNQSAFVLLQWDLHYSALPAFPLHLGNEAVWEHKLTVPFTPRVWMNTNLKQCSSRWHFHVAPILLFTYWCSSETGRNEKPGKVLGWAVTPLRLCSWTEEKGGGKEDTGKRTIEGKRNNLPPCCVRSPNGVAWLVRLVQWADRKPSWITDCPGVGRGFQSTP